MQNYWLEFSTVAVAHLLAVASPGPDFAIVLKQSIVHGRRIALRTAAGVGSAILVHVTYSLLGLGVLVRQSELWFDIVKYAGAVYIAWLGLQCLRAKPRSEMDGALRAPSNRVGNAHAVSAPPSVRAAFAAGFLTNTLNPKATLFFIALFALVVDPRTPKLVQAGYGLWMAVATAAWFSVVAVVFTRDDVRRRFLRHGHWIDRALGVVFLGFAASLALASVR